MSRPVVVHVVGTGTIGEPLIGLLSDHRADFGIDEVTFHKRTPQKNDRSKIRELVRRGARLVVDEDRAEAFRAFDMPPAFTNEEALDRATIVIDCSPQARDNKEEHYEPRDDGTRGFIAPAAGGFGALYARGINDAALPSAGRFVQVASCNTHNLAIIPQTIAFPDGQFDALESARFLVLRRANDISQDDGFCPSPVAMKHTDAVHGTHHARDMVALYKSLGVELKDIFSSVLKLNTQYMHTIHFGLRLRRRATMDGILEAIQKNDRLAVTWKTSSNAVFSFGRDHGHYGRILNQTVFCAPSLHVSPDGRDVTGVCFTPQDGNPLLSSVAAMLFLLDPKTYEARLQALKPYFFEEV